MIPLIGDQPKNAKIAEKHGIAMIVEKSEMSEDKLYESIREIITNPRFDPLKVEGIIGLVTPTL